MAADCEPWLVAGGGAVPDVEDPFLEAKNKLSAGAYALTIPYARQAIKEDPENGDAYYFLALALQSTGKQEAAKRVFTACLEKATRGQYLVQCKIGAPKKKQ